MNEKKIRAAKIAQFKTQIAEAREELRRARFPGVGCPAYSANVQNSIRQEISYLETKLDRETR